MEKDILKVEQITIRYDKNELFKELSFRLKKGEKLAVTGDSGIGKTSLVNALLGFIPVSDGKIFWNGILLNSQNINTIRAMISWLPQETALDFENVEDLIYTPFRFKNNQSFYPAENEVYQLLEKFNLPLELLKKNIDEISGGQKQRLLLISAVLLKKPVLIIDEPTSDLDKKNKKIITDYILSLKDISVITITHDPYWIKRTQKVLAL